MSIKEMKREDYERAIKKFCADNSSSTVYLAGEISHPGISDLDFLIVEDIPIVDRSVMPFLMGGNVLIVPEKSIENVKILEDINLNKIQGHDYVLNEPPDEHSLIELLEWLPERILKCKFSLRSDLKKDEVLLLHKSINRSIQKVEKLLDRSYENISTNYARSNESLDKEVILETSIKAGLQAWKDFSNFLQDNRLITGKAVGEVNLSSYYNFENNFQSLLLYFHFLKNQNLSISNALSTRIISVSNELYIDPGLERYILKRWNVMDDVYNWFVENRVKSGMIKYGWLLSNVK
tara:strand:+ start:1213 stop:2091 length:879 start_codon:yes stop_codon:yes gene_type:complete